MLSTDVLLNHYLDASVVYSCPRMPKVATGYIYVTSGLRLPLYYTYETPVLNILDRLPPFPLVMI